MLEAQPANSFFNNIVSALLITEQSLTILEDIEEVMGGLYSSESKNRLFVVLLTLFLLSKVFHFVH